MSWAYQPLLLFPPSGGAHDISGVGGIASAEAFGSHSVAASINGSGGVLLSDDFNRSDAPLASPWYVFQGSFGVVSSAAEAGIDSSIAARTETLGDDQYAQVVVASSGQWCGVIVRGLNLGGGSFRGYAMWFSSNTLRFGKLVPGAWGSALWSDFTLGTALVDGDVVRYEVEGQGAAISFKAYVNGDLQTTLLLSDSSEPSTQYNDGYAGIFGYTTDASRVDDFEAGSGTGAGSGIPSAEAFGAPTITVGHSISGAGNIASQEAVGSPAVATSVSAQGIPSAEAFGQPAVSAGVSAIGISSAEGFGQPGVGAELSGVGGIASGEAFGLPTVAGGPSTISAQSIPSAEAFGPPAVSAEISGAGGVASGEAFGAPTVSSIQNITGAGGIVSAETFGSPSVEATIGTQGIPSAEAFGQPAIASGIFTIGIPGAEGFGQPAVSAEISGAGGIASEEAFGLLAASTGPYTITVQSIPSSEAFGNPSIEVSIAAIGIASLESFGLPRIFDPPVMAVIRERARRHRETVRVGGPPSVYDS